MKYLKIFNRLSCLYCAQVIDKREVVFRDRRTELLFPGFGQSLDNNKETVGNEGNKTKIHSLESVKETGVSGFI
jgi:hypothetical protein